MARKVLPAAALPSGRIRCPIEGCACAWSCRSTSCRARPGCCSWCKRCRPQLARDAETVQSMYQDYQELSLSRQGLKRLYGLVSDAGAAARAPIGARARHCLQRTAVRAAVGSGRRHAGGGAGRLQPAPSGPQPRRAGHPHRVVQHHDHAAGGGARGAAAQSGPAGGGQGLSRKHPGQALGRRPVVRQRARACARPTPAPSRSWVSSWSPFIGISLGEWGLRDSRLAEIGRAILGAIDQGRQRVWEEQMEFRQPGREEGVAAARIHAASRCESGFVLVFDDITRLLQAQRYRRLGRGGAAPCARDQEPAHPDPALGGAPYSPVGRQAQPAGRRDADAAPPRPSWRR